MKIIATMPVRNEAWILGFSARAIMRWVDHLVILDHCSTDGSRGIESNLIDEFPGRVTVLLEENPVWNEMNHRQRMLEFARYFLATHVVLVDADEVLTANLVPVIRNLIEDIPGNSILTLPWVCLARGVDRFYAEGAWYNNWVCTAFKDNSKWYWAPQGPQKYDYHHRHPFGLPFQGHQPVKQKLEDHGGGLMHFQFVNERRLRAKQAHYQIDEVLRWPGRMAPDKLARMYGRAVYESDPDYTETALVHPEWLGPYSDLIEQGFDPIAEPWQEAVVRKAVETRGRGFFKGLDLFGVA